MVEEGEVGGPDHGTVCIEIPAEPRFVALTRVAAASLAADLDAAIDDVEDLRVAVNELVGLLVEATNGRVVVRLWSDDMVVHVTGHCVGDSPADVDLDVLAVRILDATVDAYDVGDGVFRMHKYLQPV